MACTTANPLPIDADPATGRIAVAMSGGVDSSAVAAMLKAAGEDIVGLTLQLWNQRRLREDDSEPEAVTGRCCSLDDVYDARRVAEQIGIPYYVVNQQQRFEEDVVRPFVREYLAGRTPIPCTLCNNHLKFDQLLLTAQQIGAERIATGHYARNEYCPRRERWILKRAADASSVNSSAASGNTSKDQTYFLFGLTQYQLSRSLFPLGNMTKPEVRIRAAEHGLALATKPDSQEICFIPDGDYKRFLTNYLAEQGETLPETAGEMVSPAGEVVAGSEDELLSSTLIARDVNWISIASLDAPMRVQVKIRHRHQPAWATIRPDNDEVIAEFDEPQRAITPGQGAVFYDGDEIVGGGWIV
jgi:tRNA-specific 2-thiouridylase